LIPWDASLIFHQSYLRIPNYFPHSHHLIFVLKPQEVPVGEVDVVYSSAVPAVGVAYCHYSRLDSWTEVAAAVALAYYLQEEDLEVVGVVCSLLLSTP
jgi:hypothetical protein